MASLASLFKQIDEVQVENQSVQERVDDEIRRQQAKDQSRIAWVIIWAFVVTIGVVFLLVLLVFGYGLVTCTNTGWKEPAEFLVSIVSSVLLPVVTLVLGYYFGKEKAG